MRSKRTMSYKKKRKYMKAFSMLTLVFFLGQTLLTPIGRYATAVEQNLGLSFDKTAVTEAEEFNATLTDTSEESEETLTFTVPEGLSIQNVASGQGNIDQVGLDKQSFSFKWKDGAQHQVNVKLKAEQAGNYVAQFASSTNIQRAAVTVSAPQPEVVQQTEEPKADDQSANAEKTPAATEEESTDDGESDSVQSVVEKNSESVNENVKQPTKNEKQEDSKLSSTKKVEDQSSKTVQQNAEKANNKNTEQSYLVETKASNSGLKVNGVSFANEDDVDYIVATFYKDGKVYDTFDMEIVSSGIQGISNKELTGHYNYDDIKIIIHWKNGEVTEYTSGHQSSASGNWLVMQGADFNMPDEPIPTPAPSLKVTKLVKIADTDATPAKEVTAKAGQTVEYTITIENTGNIDLTGVRLTDQFEMEGSLELTYKVGEETKTYGGEGLTIAKGESITFTAAYTIPTDINAGTYPNVATASVEVDGKTLTDKGQADVTIAAKPNITIDKTVNGEKEITAQAGEEVTYKIVVTNTGNTDLEDVVLTDEFEMEGDLPLTYKVGEETKIYGGEGLKIAKGDSITFTAAYTIPTDIKAGTYANVAVVKAGDLNKESQADVIIAAKPNITIDKTVNGEKETTAQAGEEVTYKIVVTNTGNTDLEDVVLTDEFEMEGDLPLTYKVGEETKIYGGEGLKIAKGDSITFTAAYTIPTDIKAGTYANVAAVKAGELNSNSQADVTIEAKPNITIDKTVNGEKEITAQAGEEVTYKIVVTNTGNTDLEDVVLTDEFEMEGDLPLTYKVGEETKTYGGEGLKIAKGDSITFTAAYTIPTDIKAGTYANVAAVKAGDLNKESRADVTIPAEPVLTVNKTADNKNPKPGEKVTYTITVTNTGNMDLTGITMKDVISQNGEAMKDQLTLDGYEEPFALAIGESKTFTSTLEVPGKAVAGTIYENVVVAENDETSGTDEEEVIVDKVPVLQVEKTADNKNPKPGEKVTYTITVTNTGNMDLIGITVKDVISQNGEAMKDQLTLDGYKEPFALAIGESKTFTSTLEVPEKAVAGTTYKNVVVAKNDETSGKDEEEVIVDKVPGLQVEKTADNKNPKPGEKVTYTITVTNTGNMDLTGITMKDVISQNGEAMKDQLTLDGYKEPFALAIGESKTFTSTLEVPEKAVAGTTYENVVVVKNDETSGKDEEEVIVDKVPGLQVEKTADNKSPKPGEKVTYTITVTNTGNMDLTGITMKDVFSKNYEVMKDQLTLEGYEKPFALAIGESKTFTSSFVVPKNDLADTTYSNVVTATTGDTTGKDEETVTVNPSYALTIDKTADKDKATVGDTITYTIKVTNTGNKEVTSISVVDEMIDLNVVIDKLGVNESKTFTGKYVVTSEDVGKLVNTAKVTAQMEDKKLEEEDSVTIEVSPKAEVPVTNLDQGDKGGITQLLATTPFADKVQKWIQNPKTGDYAKNILMTFVVFVSAGLGLYLYKRKFNH